MKKATKTPKAKKQDSTRPNGKKTAIKAKRGTIFFLDPEDVKIVDDKNDVLCQQDRIDLPLKEETVANYMEVGQIVSAVAEKDGKDARIVAGRRRILYLREANKRRRKAGLPGFLAKIEVRRFKNDGERAHVMFSENRHRETRDPFAELRQVQDCINKKVEGFDPAIALGCSPGTVENRLKILDLDSSVQKAVQEGKATITDVLPLTKLPRAEQKAALEKKVEVKEKMKKDKAAGILPKKAPSKDKIRAIVQVGMYSEDGPVKAALLWAIGDITEDEVCAKIVGFTGALKKIEGEPEEPAEAEEPAKVEEEAEEPKEVDSGPLKLVASRNGKSSVHRF